MIRYHSNRQLKFEFYESPFAGQLDSTNRWVELAESLPWEELSRIYHRSLSHDQGAPSKPARQVIGAVIIKHKLKLNDREVVAQIQENPYLQYFVGLEKFTHQKLFDPSLFPTIRKRLGVGAFEQMNEALLVAAGLIKEKEDKQEDKSGDSDLDGEKSNRVEPQNDSKEKPKREGKLIIDAVVTEQMIKYPNDLELISDSREEAERLIDLIYRPVKGKVKPRTYRRKARKEFLQAAKKRKKSKRVLRKAIGKQLNYLRRDLKILKDLLESDPNRLKRLTFRDLRIYWVIQHIYHQQREMHTHRVHRCNDRIVNIYQPWVRPMVTGKQSKKVEFGPKSSVSLIAGFASVHKIDWNNFHEGHDLIGQTNAYKDRYGYYPEVVIADQKYGTRDNRKWLKGKGIRFSGKALGRPKSNPSVEDLQLDKLKKEEQKLRSQIEGKFGQGKNGYNLAKIRAKLIDTSQSWLAAIYFVMNLKKFIELLDSFFAYHPYIQHIRNLIFMLKSLFREQQLTTEQAKEAADQNPSDLDIFLMEKFTIIT